MAEHDDDSVKLALLAHDLRTPLSAMRLTAELIGNGQLDVSQAEHLSILIRSIDALTEMTGELASAATPGNGAENVPNRVTDIVCECADLFRAAAEAKDLSFDVSIEEAARSHLTTHGGALRRVMSTLLDNAIKYTGAGGVAVELAEISAEASPSPASAAERRIAISVQDTGPGIDADEQARLFRPFARGRHGRETGPGTGLGLWGMAQLVDAMGGRLLLSTPDGGGSRFEVQFPLDPQEREGAAGEAASDRAVAGTSGLLPAHVLIVDDNDTNCRLLAALLESFGISSEIAGSGEQAIGLVQKKNYDAVLLDLHMPGLSGVETAEEIMALRPGKDVPLVAVSAALDSIGDDRLQQSGFQDVLTKPLAPRALYEAMERVRQMKDNRDR